MNNLTRDKNGREIKVGDILKVFHFIGARRKRHYMYKQVTGSRELGKSPSDYLVVSHLTLEKGQEYYVARDEGPKPDYEIVQGLDDFEARPKETPE